MLCSGLLDLRISSFVESRDIVACVLHLERLDTDLVATCVACTRAREKVGADALSPGSSLTIQSLSKERSLCLDVLLDSMARVLDSSEFLQLTGNRAMLSSANRPITVVTLHYRTSSA